MSTYTSSIAVTADSITITRPRSVPDDVAGLIDSLKYSVEDAIDEVTVTLTVETPDAEPQGEAEVTHPDGSTETVTDTLPTSAAVEPAEVSDTPLADETSASLGVPA